MAILLPNKDGTSAAKVGDIVVTGGGIFEKTASGSVRRTDLEATSGYSGGVGDYRTLSNTVYNTVRAAITNSGGGSGSSGGGSSTPDPEKATAPAPTPAPENVTFDANGIGYIDTNMFGGFSGFDPNTYATNTGGSSDGLKNALGYIVLGLVGLAILDKIVGGAK